MNEPIEIISGMSLASACMPEWRNKPRHIVPRNAVKFSERYSIVPPTLERGPVYDHKTGRYQSSMVRESDGKIVYSAYTEDGKRISKSKEEWAVWLVADDGFSESELGVCVVCGKPYEPTREDQVTCGLEDCKIKNRYERNKRRRLGLIE